VAEFLTVKSVVMDILSIITESMPVYTEDGTQVAVKSSLGLGKGQRVTMLVSKEEWEQIKNQPANTEDMEYDVATAESIIKDWKNRGMEIYWKTAADHNREARDLENHRFRNDPDVSANFDAGIETARGKGRSAMKNNLRTVESMKTFKEYLMEYDRSDIALQQQHAGTLQQQPAQQQPKQGAFQKQMGATPQKGDVIETPAGRFVVLGGSMEGIQVKQLGAGGRTISVPHGTKFQPMGQGASGKNVFQIVK